MHLASQRGYSSIPCYRAAWQQPPAAVVRTNVGSDFQTGANGRGVPAQRATSLAGLWLGAVKGARTLRDGPSPKHPNIGRFSSQLEDQFLDNFGEPFVTFRVMDEHGGVLDPALEPDVTQENAVRMYKTMVQLNVMDSILYEAQRQGRLSFYMTNYGEEATHIGSASVLSQDDVIYGQYREAGVLLWRGFTVQQCIDQCVGNVDASCKGRMMPVHYGSRALNFHTISSPLATQLPQAAGAAYALKSQQRDACVVCYFGDGAASEGDFHGALNFAATLECPVIFFCRNNGYAISTPIREQYRGDGIAARGVSYNIKTARCDGNDTWAVHHVMKRAREIAVRDKVPILVEAMTYRGGHHSTSDDASRYRGTDELNSWTLSNNPMARMRLFMEKKKWWSQEMEAEARAEARKGVLESLEAAEGKQWLKVEELFQDVYDQVPHHLQEQQVLQHYSPPPSTLRSPTPTPYTPHPAPSIIAPKLWSMPFTPVPCALAGTTCLNQICPAEISEDRTIYIFAFPSLFLPIVPENLLEHLAEFAEHYPILDKYAK